MDIANITITGRLGGDPEEKDINGQKVVNFSVASNLGKKDEPPTWFRVSVWGGQADPCLKYLRKGSPATVSGKLQPRTYEKDGQVHTSLDVRANDVHFSPQAKQANEVAEDELPF